MKSKGKRRKKERGENKEHWMRDSEGNQNAPSIQVHDQGRVARTSEDSQASGIGEHTADQTRLLCFRSSQGQLIICTHIPVLLVLHNTATHSERKHWKGN